jgi:hypothetical protein
MEQAQFMVTVMMAYVEIYAEESIIPSIADFFPPN